MSKVGGSETKNALHCSFCGKSQHELHKLIAGPTVFICNECVELWGGLTPKMMVLSGSELTAMYRPCDAQEEAKNAPSQDDPNLTDKKYPGNPTKSYRSRESLRVAGEVTDWQGHSPEALKAMKDHIERLRQLGVEAIDD
jgi:hypothetical protein